VHADGEAFYEAELAAIRQARQSIHIEAFIFLRSQVADRFLATLIERANAGVVVRLIVDAIGSAMTADRYFDKLREAGGRVTWYQPIRWRTLKRFNNRTHRELTIVDGEIGFIGGAGIAAWWVEQGIRGLPWRDTVLQIRGDLVGGLQATFAENWLEASGEILSGEEYFPNCMAEPSGKPAGTQAGLVIASTPSAAGSTRARMLFQILLASARESIQIASPYFLPDRSIRRELTRAVGRGVRVTVITPGAFNNHPIARRASRRRYGELIRGGAQIFEYQPRMIHAKILIIDGIWTVLGSTNFDNRSFGLNDEVNIAICDEALAAQLQQDFEKDLNESMEISLDAWQRRPLTEKLIAFIGIVLERQQ
jgi:cardiolipin synthase